MRTRLQIPWSLLGGELASTSDPRRLVTFREMLSRMSRGLIGLNEDEAYSVMVEAAAGVADRVAHEREQWERNQVAFAPLVQPDGSLVFMGSNGSSVTVRAGQGVSVRALVDTLVATTSEKKSLEAELQKRGESNAAELRRLQQENARLEAECDRLRSRRKKTVRRDTNGQILEVIEAPA